MAWRLEIHHVPGRLIPAPDATSRSPHNRNSIEPTVDKPDWPTASTALAAIRMVHDVDDMEVCIIAAARSSLPAMQSVLLGNWSMMRLHRTSTCYS